MEKRNANLKTKTTKDYEGFRDKPYQDPSNKNRSVGYGINIDDPANKGLVSDDVISGKRSMTQQEGDDSYNKKMTSSQNEARKNIKDYDKLDEDVKGVVDDLYYNMGGPKAKSFDGFHKAINKKDYNRAGDELQYRNADTKEEETPYYKQTKDRAKDHVATLKGKELKRQLNARMGIEK